MKEVNAIEFQSLGNNTTEFIDFLGHSNASLYFVVQLYNAVKEIAAYYTSCNICFIMFSYAYSPPSFLLCDEVLLVFF